MGGTLTPLTRRILTASVSFAVGYALPFAISSLGLAGKILFVLGWPIGALWIAGNLAIALLFVILFDGLCRLFRRPDEPRRAASPKEDYLALALLGFLSAIVVLAWRSL